MKNGIPTLCLLLLTVCWVHGADIETEPIAAEDVMKLLSQGRPADVAAADEPRDAAAEAEDPAPPPGPAGTEPANEVAAAYTGPRDPFWPVGYVPRPKEDPAEQDIEVIPRYVERWPKLVLRGIILQGKEKYMAVLDGVGIVETGEVVAIERGGLVYRWQIDKINRTEISYTRLAARPGASLPRKGVEP